jgi:hypothetical protein
VLLGRALRDPQQRGDAVVRAPLGHGGEDLALARRQGLERVLPAARCHQLGDHLRVECRPATGHAPERVHEFAHVADAVLQQVTDPSRAIGKELRRVLPLDVLAEDQHRRPGHLPARLDGRAQALVALAGRHPNVDHRDIRAMLDHRLDE